MKPIITAIGTAVPRFKANQMKIAQFMSKAHQFINGKEHKLFSLYKATEINSRYTVIEDYGSDTVRSFFPDTPDLEPFPSTEKRMAIYRKEAKILSKQAIQNCLQKMEDFDKSSITHLITISCTGMYAPGLDIELIKELELKSSTKRTAINFMGCYAAINGLKVADAICRADEHARVLVVAVELCTIHFQKKLTNDNLFANALFADGAAAMVIQNQPRKGINLRIENFVCALDENSEEDMAWEIGDSGFEMKLSAYVPGVIKNGIKSLSKSLIEGLADTRDVDYYAIHPGGKKIIDVIEEELDLSSLDTRYSRSVLRDFGNMSSPTVLFVLERIANDLTSKDDSKRIMSFAFGPGLTMEGALLSIEYH